MSISKICNDGPSYRVGEAPRATPFGLARLPNIDLSVMYQISGILRHLILQPSCISSMVRKGMEGGIGSYSEGDREKPSYKGHYSNLMEEYKKKVTHKN